MGTPTRRRRRFVRDASAQIRPGNRRPDGGRWNRGRTSTEFYWDGFKEELPYRTCLVKLDEGPLIISNLVGDDAKTRIGARLRVMFERVTEEIVLPKFALD